MFSWTVPHAGKVAEAPPSAAGPRMLNHTDICRQRSNGYSAPQEILLTRLEIKVQRHTGHVESLPTQKRTASHDPERLVDLMVAYQRGDSDAFEQLYLALKPQIYGYLIQVTWDRGWAEDLLQETFLQLHRARRTYQPGRAVLPWVFAIARHVYLASRRSQARRHSRETQYPEPEMATLSISLELERLADHELIGRALTAVPEERREVLLLHHMWGFTFAEIGAMLGIRAGTAKVRAHRGMRDLRHELDLLTDT